MSKTSMPAITDEMRCQLLRCLAADPDVSQRQLAGELGISLGKLNYCLHAVISKGWVKACKINRNPNKKVYGYLLAPKGIEVKARLTVRFLQYKITEYDKLMVEIAELRQEVKDLGD